MSLNRREFVVLGCAMAAGCASMSENAPVRLKDVSIDAGSASDYASEGVYSRFASQGFFIVRRGQDLFALSSSCTHRHCELRAEPNQSFYCKCHGSEFSPTGKVIEGPATIDLPRLPTNVDERGHLMIRAVAT
jgi:Rieske Fe-S protein